MATEYLVLYRTDYDAWAEAGKAAGTARQAIQSVAKEFEGGLVGDEWMAVPVRSWQPVKMQVETAFKFSSA